MTNNLYLEKLIGALKLRNMKCEYDAKSRTLHIFPEVKPEMVPVILTFDKAEETNND